MVGLRTSAAIWKTVMEMFSSQSQARVVQLRTKLNQCRKENKTGQVYLDEIKGLSDEMAVAGKLLNNMDVISHILSGLDEEYDGFVAAIAALINVEKNVSLSDVYSQFMSYEARMESRKSGDGSSINSVTHGGRGGGRGRGDYQDQYRDRWNMSSAITMDMVAMTATIMITAMVAMVDMVGVVAMAAETLKEIALIMNLESMRFVKYAGRRVIVR
jgi:hypothetical protein